MFVQDQRRRWNGFGRPRVLTVGAELRRPVRRRWDVISIFLVAGCLPPKAERLTCDNLLDASQVRYFDLEALMTGQGAKGCGYSNCHGAEVANRGIRFDEPSSAFDALTTRIDTIYGEVASGQMPKDGTAWDESDLQLLRSWYCNGSFPSP